MALIQFLDDVLVSGGADGSSLGFEVMLEDGGDI